MFTFSLLYLFFRKSSTKAEYEGIISAICLASDLNIIAQALF